MAVIKFGEKTRNEHREREKLAVLGRRYVTAE